MARPNVPTIPDDKILYFKEQLYRELSHMFTWSGLPSEVPVDYLERNLVRHGYVLYYEDEEIGHDVLRCEVQGYNRHNLPVQARTYTPNTVGDKTQVIRNLKYLSDNKNVAEQFDPAKDGVLITNTGVYTNSSRGNIIPEVVEHFAKRLALAQQAFDTNLMYANMPYIFVTDDENTRLSIERMFSKMFSGEPFIITDKALLKDNQNREGVPTNIPFIGKELMDVHNEIMMKFKQTVGFDTAGVDKAERVNTLEVQSNTQHTKTVVQIMLEQRQIACETINTFFGTNISVSLVGGEELEQKRGGKEDGSDDSGIEGPPRNKL